MAIANKDPQELEDALLTWLQAQLPGATDVRIDKLTVPQASGLSNLTILFDAAWTQDGEARAEALVARVAPDGPAVFMTYDLGKEFRVMRALADRTPVPVPPTRWVEEDPSHLGAPFLVMDRATGEIPADDPRSSTSTTSAGARSSGTPSRSSPTCTPSTGRASASASSRRRTAATRSTATSRSGGRSSTGPAAAAATRRSRPASPGSTSTARTTTAPRSSTGATPGPATSCSARTSR